MVCPMTVPVLLLLLLLALALLAGAALGWLLAARRGTAAAGELVSARAQLAARAEGAAEADRRVRESFAALSEQALRANAEAVVRMARDALGTAGAAASGDLAHRQQAIDALVAPLRDSLARLEAHTGALETARTEAYAGLREQLGSVRAAGDGLRAETARLVASLRATGVRGRWGELQLRRVVELAGMTEHCDFETQVTVRTADGVQRPDLVVALAGARRVVVDAKAPFDAYIAAADAPVLPGAKDPGDPVRYAGHARAVREHVRRLADRDYPRAVPGSAEFVVLFLPGDGMLAAAAAADPGLVEDALARGVVLATPTTLVAVLRTVASVWREDALVANAAELRRLAGELYQRLATMGGHLAKVGSGLNASVTAYNSAVGSLESRVLVTARRMAELHESDAPLVAPETLELRPRAPRAAELTDPAEPEPGRVRHLDGPVGDRAALG